LSFNINYYETGLGIVINEPLASFLRFPELIS